MSDVERVAASARIAGYADALMEVCEILCASEIPSETIVRILNEMLAAQARYKQENPSS